MFTVLYIIINFKILKSSNDNDNNPPLTGVEID